MVTNRWIEQELSVTQFDAWLSVLRRHNPLDALIVERAWYLVEEALSGRPPPKRLRLEDASSADLGCDCRNPSILLPLVNVRDGDAVKPIPAGLSVFRIGDDGKLTFARKYDIDVGDKTMFWMGMVPL